jgi:tRNA(Ile)-lysidine synthetase-like protein
MISRFASNLRSDDDFIRSVARDFLESHSVITNKDLLSLHGAVFSRVVSMMCDAAGASVTHKQINAIRENLSTGNFSLSVTGGSFVSEYSKCHIEVNDGINYEYRFEIMEGLNSLSGFDADFLLSRGDVDKSSLNVYKISIQANLRSAIIDGELYLRPKMDGDSVYYGGMSHKLKKLFNDRKIPPAIRPSIPILCDSRGVVWVPGFGVRDDGVSGEGNDLRVCLMIGKSDTLSEVRMRSGNEFKS